MPRKLIELTEQQIKDVEEMASHLTQAQMAGYLGIGERTFRDIMARDDRLSAAYKKGRSSKIKEVVDNLFDKCQAGDTTAIIFFLKTQAGWREPRDDAETVQPIQINFVNPDGTSAN
jgi:hypothetical protein